MKKAEEGLRRTEQEVERDGLRFTRERATASVYIDWVKQIDWKLFCTLTFAWRVSDPQADKTFAEFINRLEHDLKSDVAYVRGDEKRFSGCGKPACGRHFHVLLTSAAPMHPISVESLWMEMAGNRSDDAGAKVEPYDPAQSGAKYVLKFINELEGDWKFRKLELFHLQARGLQDMTKRFRRRLRRHKAREKTFNGLKSHFDRLTKHMLGGKS